MTTPDSKPRRLGWLAVVLVVVLAGIAAWVLSTRGAGTDPDAAARGTAASQGDGGKVAARLLDKPLWSELTRAQQLALEPLRAEWDAMDGARKKKWLEMSRHFASMNAVEQRRVHERMREWIRLTPEQRKLARENYSKARKLPPGEKTATWESYKQLSADQRRRLVQSATRKKAATVSPPANGGIVAPTPCPAGTTRRGASCISLEEAANANTAAVPPQPAPAAPAPAAPLPSAPNAPAASTSAPTAPTASHANE